MLLRNSLCKFSQDIGGLLDTIQGTLKQDIYSLTLEEKGGRLYIGELDPRAPFELTKWTPVQGDQFGHWKINAKINGIDLTQSAVIDSATVSIMVSHEIAESLYASANIERSDEEGLMLGMYDCHNPPNVTIQIAESTIRLSELSILLGKSDSDPSKCYWPIVGAAKNQQFGADAIFGAAFMKSMLDR